MPSLLGTSVQTEGTRHARLDVGKMGHASLLAALIWFLPGEP
ncbi:hypothetical protein [Streptomyces sp. NBC_01238]